MERIDIPTNKIVYELSSSTVWLDEMGILWSVSKRVPPQTVEQVKEDLNKLIAIVGQKKVCMVSDVTHASEITREVREVAAQELPKFIKAIAIISHNKAGIMLANLFFKLKSQPYPVKMFNTSSEAKDWIIQFL